MKQPVIWIVALSLLSLPASGAIHSVPGNYPTIQGAINVSAPYDTVLVDNGQYFEYLVINTPLTLSSRFILDADSTHILNTILEGPDTLGNDNPCIIVEGLLEDTLRVVGLTIRHYEVPPLLANGVDGAAIQCTNANLSLNLNHFIANRARTGGAIWVLNGDAKFYGNVFDNNEASRGGAVHVRNGFSIVRKNTFTYNSTFEADGAGFRGFEASGVVDENVFIGNDSQIWGGALELVATGSWVVENNWFEFNISGDGSGLEAGGLDSIIVRNNIFIENYSLSSFAPGHFGRGAAAQLELSYPGQDHFLAFDNNLILGNTSEALAAVDFNATGSFDGNFFIANRASYTSAVETRSVNTIPSFMTGSRNLFQFNHPIPDSIEYYKAVAVSNQNSMSLDSSDFLNNWILSSGLYPWHTSGGFILENNYWGDPSGPYHPTVNPAGVGDTVDAELDPIPFATDPFIARALSPGQLIYDFGAVAIDSVVEESVYLRNSHVTPIDIDELRIVPSSESVYAILDSGAATIAAGDSTQVRFRFQPSEEGRITATLVAIYHLGVKPEAAAVWLQGDGGEVAVDERIAWATPQTLSLQTWPNPFNDRTTVRVQVPVAGTTRVALYDLLGREVRVLNNQRLAPGNHHFSLDANGLSSGIYFVSVRDGTGRTVTRKLLLVR